MSSGGTPEDTSRARDPGGAVGGGSPAGGGARPVPVAADRPVVDGAGKSAAELVAEVEELSDERRQEVERLREEVGATVGELAARLDVPARLRDRRDASLAGVRARSRSAARAAWQRRAAVGATAVALLLVVLARGRSATRGSPASALDMINLCGARTAPVRVRDRRC